jgi:hypothetical protein
VDCFPEAPQQFFQAHRRESAIDPNKAVTAQLIEESDEGFYIVGPTETRAIFVPRSSVALVYFSDKVAESPLLREAK